MNLELYTVDTSPFANKVELMLEIKGVEYTRHTPDREFVREGGYGDINPIRKIPSLIVDGLVIPEAEIICQFIEDTFPEPSLTPDDPSERARMRLLSRVADLYVMQPIIDMLNNTVARKSADIEEHARDTAARGLNWLEHWIAPGPYALGDRRSAADCGLAPFLFTVKDVFPLMKLGELPPMGPKTTTYYAAVSEDEDVARCLKRMSEAVKARFG